MKFLMYYPVYNKIDYNEDNKQLIGKAIYFSHCIKLKDKRIMIITNSGGIMRINLQWQMVIQELLHILIIIQITN